MWRFLFIVAVSLLCSIPFVIVNALSYWILRKLSFTARVNGFFEFTEIMLRYEVKMNFAIVVRIEKI